MLASCGGPQKFPMSIYKQPCSPVFNRSFDPVFSVYPHSDSQYDCPEITDQDFAEMGVLRCLSDSRTGRDFLQRHGDFARKTVTVSHHFKSLQSKRRLKSLCSINSLSAAQMTDRCQDPFDSIAELEGFAIYAGAAHDRRRLSSSGVMKKLAVGHFFMLNLRTHHLRHLTLGKQDESRKSEHDMHVIKRTHTDALRCAAGRPKVSK